MFPTPRKIFFFENLIIAPTAPPIAQAHNSVQMFEPFQDRNQHFFGSIRVSWLVMKSIPKTFSFNLFLTKSLRKFSLNWNLDFGERYFQFLPWNRVFPTYMKSNAAVTLHLEDLTVKKYLFLKDVCIFWWKISNCLIKYVASFFTLSWTLQHLVIKIFKKKNFTMIQST